MGGCVPASTRPETLSTMVLGSLVSRSLTVTVTPFQARVWTVVLRRGVSARVPCSRSTVGASLVAGPGYEAEDDTLVVAIVGGLRGRGQVRRRLRMAGREERGCLQAESKDDSGKDNGKRCMNHIKYNYGSSPPSARSFRRGSDIGDQPGPSS